MQSILVEHSALFIILFAIAIGLSAALLAWAVSRRVADVPAENREYKDVPPLGFRLGWLPIQWISHFIEPLISAKTSGALLIRLRKAGLDFAITPPQFTAARMVCALFVGSLLCWAMYTLGRQADSGTAFHAKSFIKTWLAGVLFGWVYPTIWLRDLLARRKSELLKTLPFYLDVITLCVEAGLNMQGAMNQAVSKGPKGVLRDELQRVLRDIRAGKGRADSLRAMSDRLGEPNVANFVTSVVQAESMGMNLGPVLRAQADQRRSERFLRAEKLAMEAPVKMLFPLIAFIFPCTFIVLFFPIVMKFMHSGL